MNSKISFIKNLDCETPMSIHDDVLRVDWYEAGEGLCGDYNPDNPEDQELLRFDVYIKKNPEPWDNPDDRWCEVEDASYCTLIPTNTSEEILEKALRYIFSEYRDVIKDNNYPSVKKIGERLSWISPDMFKEKDE